MKVSYEPQQLLLEQTNTLESDFLSILRMIPSQETNFLTHNLHNYAAKFLPHFPRIFIRNLTAENELVVDPMMGSGTTLIEASLLNRKGIGIDIDPIGYLIAKVATTPIEDKKLCTSIRQLKKNLIDSFEKGWKKAKLPSYNEYPNHSLWFREETLMQLIFIKLIFDSCFFEVPVNE